MSPTAIKDFKTKKAYTKLVQKALFSYLWEGIYKPMFEMLQIKPTKARNSLDAVTQGLKEGSIYYVNGGFKAKKKFTAAQSLLLQQWGAKFDSREKMYKIDYSSIPMTVRVALADARISAQNTISQIDAFLKEVEANIPYIVDSMVFDNEVITILDDAGNEVKKNVKKLNVIVPELTEEQKQEIAQSYTNNMRFYVKDFEEKRIPEMRRKIAQMVLDGYRTDSIQKMLEQEYGIMSRKAEFLAQNETTIMLAQYKRVTYQEMGFEKFIWSTILDGREREEHKKLNGKIFRYDDPPIIDERTGQRGLPGEIYNCRCEAIPYRDDNILRASNSYDDVDSWITVKGNHIPIKEGQTKEEAIKEFIESKEGKQTNTPADDGISGIIKKAYEIYKEVNCESTKPAYHYPKTVAGVKRGKTMTFEQADNGRANPNFNRNNYAYSHNCQSCVVAHELRLRGYDVKAAPKARSGKTAELAKNSAWAWIDPKTGKKCEYTKINVKNASEYFDYLNKNIKPGVNYQMAYSWQDKKKNKHGHVLTISRNSQGVLRMYDPQTNLKLEGMAIKKYFRNPAIIYNNTNLKPRVLRVDDKKVNPYFIDDVVQKL